MASNDTFHALGLHMHQPPDNLNLLIEQERWEAEQIMRCYARPLSYARQYADVARLHVGFSGILLEQFLDPSIVERYSGITDIPAMLKEYGKAENVELIGMGYYHPIFPLIPTDDWAEHLALSREMARKVFGREPKGFWPPEMAFSMEMVPYLARAGYEYVLVDSVHVRPVDRPGDRCTPYKPYLAERDGASIVVIPRNRDVSNAQESGMDAGWFENEVLSKVSDCPAPRLMTTWSDGENGGWFRQTHEPSGFWGHYFAPFMERVRSGSPIRPVLISEYLRDNPPTERVEVRTGAWNVATTSGYDFSQWAGSPTQRKAIEEIVAVSTSYHDLARELEQAEPGRKTSTARQLLGEARRHVLQSETSCYLFWGDTWVNRVYEVTGPARKLIDEAKRKLWAPGTEET